MTIKYECYYCKNTFPASKSIDAYDKGFKTGFLCPECGKNIQAGLLAKQKLAKEHYKWLIITILLYFPVFATRKSETTILISNIEININTALFISWMLYAVVLFILKPHLLMARTFLTEPVDNK